MKNTAIRFTKVSKNYGDLQAVNNFNLDVSKGEIVSIIGPNGCGKSTLLKMVAGIIPSSSGQHKLQGKAAYMPQKNSLMPWLTIRQNLELPFTIKNQKPDNLSDKVSELLTEFGLKEFSEYHPGQLSGGMQQKASILQAIIIQPDILLLDEPFSALDAITRRSMQRWLVDVWQKNSYTVLCVTHDIREALLLSDRIVVLSERPAKILDIFSIEGKRPRTNKQLSSKKMLEIEMKLEELLIS